MHRFSVLGRHIDRLGFAAKYGWFEYNMRRFCVDTGICSGNLLVVILMQQVPEVTITNRNDTHIAIWLLICAAVIYGMIVLGGVTRLTGSGLSMVDWNPIMGIIPPLTDHQWQETFDAYKQFPEYQKVNSHMDVHDFKQIFVFEYSHRVLGRLIGMLFFFPFLFFLFKGKVKSSLKPKLWGLFVLGGLQGFMGWFMVKSGLVDMPRVSHLRLTAHLGLAVIIYGAMLWLAFSLLMGREVQVTSAGLRRFSVALALLIFVMILSGGLVAGLDAGFAYNTFPLMDGRFFPVGLYNLDPWWKNIFNDITTVQFNHRLFAYLITILVLVFALRGFKKGASGRIRIGLGLLIACLVLQVALGISTLLMVVPVPLAAAHQAGAIALLSAAIFVANRYWLSQR